MSKVSIEGQGIELAEFDSATFEIAVKKTEPTGKRAKEATKEVQNELIKCIKGLKEICGEKFNPTIQTQLDLRRASFWDEATRSHISRGYTATFKMYLTTTDMANLGSIHNELTSVMGAEVESPTFALDPARYEACQTKAFETAFKMVERRLAQQAQVLKVNAAAYRVESWDTKSDDHASSNLKGMTIESDHLKVHAGRAKITVNLTVHYERYND